MHWRGTVSIGSAIGTEVQLHWTLFLFGGFQLLRAAADDSLSLGSVALALLAWLIALAVHTFGHVFVARRRSFELEGTVVGPFGDLEEVASARDPMEGCRIALGGLGASLLFALPLGIYVAMTDQFHSYFLRQELAEGTPDFLAVLWGAHFDLFWINLIPAFPFDGGRILAALIERKSDPETALQKAVLSSRLSAFGCLLFFLIWMDQLGILILAGIFCVLGSEIERRRRVLFSASDGWEGGSPVARVESWWQTRRRLEESRRLETEARERVADEARLDQLLAKVSREGLPSLTRSEKKFLKRQGERKQKDRSPPESRDRD